MLSLYIGYCYYTNKDLKVLTEIMRDSLHEGATKDWNSTQLVSMLACILKLL